MYDSDTDGAVAGGSYCSVIFDFDLWNAPDGALPLDYMENAAETEMYLSGGGLPAGEFKAYSIIRKTSSVEVPEPSTLALLSFGLLSLAAKRHFS